MGNVENCADDQMARLARIESQHQLMEASAGCRFPPSIDERMQRLMDFNNDGELSDAEREELAALADLGTAISLLKAHAMRLLGRKPFKPGSRSEVR